MVMGLAGAMKQRVATTQRAQGFSKAWSKGTRLHTFFRLERMPMTQDSETLEPMIVVAAEYMHNVDHKALPSLKRVAIPSNSIINEDGEVVRPDIMLRFNSIARLFIEGRKNAEMEKIMKNTHLKGSSQQKALVDKEAEFKNIQPAIGKLDYKIATEVVCVEVNDKGEFLADTIKQYSMDLSSKRARKLISILKDPDHAPLDDENYLEVKFTFGTTGERNQDGQVDPVGVTRGAEGTCVASKNPAIWRQVQEALAGLPEDSETLRRRNSSFSKMDEESIFSALSTYAAMHAEDLSTLPEDMESRLNKQADVFADLRLSEIVVGDKTYNFSAIVAERAEAEAEAEAETPIVVKAEAAEDSDFNIEQDADTEKLLADIGVEE